MKLFKSFKAVKFPEENLIFITKDAYIYYIYNPKYKNWRKHKNAGNDKITVKNYEDISEKELTETMGGIFPEKETDFLRLCPPSDLCVRDMLDLLKEDYPEIMSDCAGYVHEFLLNSDICYKSYMKLRKLFDNAAAPENDNKQIVSEIKKLCFDVIGRDIFKYEIEIIDGHNSSSYFWIMPVRVIDFTDTCNHDNVAEMWNLELSIEEDNVSFYLTPFLYKHFDDELEANKKRVRGFFEIDDDGNEHPSYISGFEWYLTHNFYTLDSVAGILKDIGDTIEALSSGKENEFTSKIKRSSAAYREYVRNSAKENNADIRTEEELIIDFYRRFIYRMEYMMKIGKEKGYNLISFMGP